MRRLGKVWVVLVPVGQQAGAAGLNQALNGERRQASKLAGRRSEAMIDSIVLVHVVRVFQRQERRPQALRIQVGGCDGPTGHSHLILRRRALRKNEPFLQRLKYRIIR